MRNNKTRAKKAEVYIRSDGWVFSKEGMDRLKAGGHKGFARFKESMESKLGEWHRVSKPLDKDAAAALKSVKGLVARGQFLSSAIIDEEVAESRSGYVAVERKTAGSPAEFMRLTLTDDAYAVVRTMPNPDFREFVSSAILRKMAKPR